MKKIILVLVLGLIVFSCSDDTKFEDGTSVIAPKEPELLYFASAKIDGASLNIEYYLDDKPKDAYNPYPGHEEKGEKSKGIEYMGYRGGLTPTGLNTSIPMLEVYFQDFANNAGVSDYTKDYEQIEKIFYKGKFPFAEKEVGYGIRVVYGKNGVKYSSTQVRQDIADSYFKVTNVELLDTDKDGALMIEVTGEFKCKVKAPGENEETLEISNGKFKFLYSSFGKDGTSK